MNRHHILAAASRRRLLASIAIGASALVVAAPVLADLPSVIPKLKPSVLPVGTYSATDSPRFGFHGSGFVVGDGNLLATNYHVLPPGADTESVSRLAVVAGRDGSNLQLRQARVVAVDRQHDLALLRFDGAPLPAVTLAPVGTAREGEAVALMGYPIGSVFGFAPVTHRGIIAAKTTIALPAATAQQLDPRAVARLRSGNFEVYQLDATAYPGNSGGPVFDVETGQVLAIVNMVLVRGSRESALSQPTGISYAIPVEHLVELLKGR